jgi:CRISPR-associated protein Cas2
MAEQKHYLNGYKLMWSFVMFDLPVMTPQQRKAAHDFREDLLKKGFFMAQYSVYYKPLAGKEELESINRYIKSILPNEGHVEIIGITDKQYENIICYWGRKLQPPFKNPEQLLLF